MPGGATYSATKHAVVGLTEAIRGEIRGSGVETSVVMPVPVNTELAAGLVRGRGLTATVEPEQVADAIVEALERPRHDVYVPKAIVAGVRLGALLPRRLAEAIGRSAKTHRILAEATWRRAQPTSSAPRPARASREHERVGGRLTAADGPWRNRTSNLGIKSPLLCQLS